MGRFSCPSSELSLSSLFSHARIVLAVNFLIALGIHALLAQIRLADDSIKVSKPLTTKFIKREPRLAKPLEFRKRPKPKQRPMRRKIVLMKAKVSKSFSTSAPQSLKVLDSLARPKEDFSWSVFSGPPSLENPVNSSFIYGNKEPEQKVDMSLEMLDIDALDTGRYHAMVIQDPSDKKKIEGFFHFYIAYAAGARTPDLGGAHTEHPNAIPILIKAINRYTDIRTDIAGFITYDSGELFKTPFVYNAASVSGPSGGARGRSFSLTDTEARNLGKYLMSGGFLVADNSGLNDATTQALQRIFIDALGSVGKKYERDWNFESLPSEHPIFHCYFDFDSPPRCGDWLAGWAPSNMSHDIGTFLGITIDNRLVGIQSNMDYEDCWGFMVECARSLQFGVNMVIFALTQEGSITQQVMDAVE